MYRINAAADIWMSSIVSTCRLALLIVSLSACILFATQPASANSAAALWNITPEPSWGSQAAVVTSDDTDTARFFSVVEKHRRIELDTANSISYFRYSYTINNDSGVEETEPITVEFDPTYQTVQLHKAVVHRDGEAINQLHRDSIQLLQREMQMEDGLYDGNQTLHLLLSDQRVGDRIEYSYSIVGDNPVYDGHVFGWVRLQAGVPVGNYYFKLRYPESINVATRSYAGEVSAVADQSDSGYRQLTWRALNTEPVEYQSDVPSSHIAQTHVQYSDFPNWSAVAEWAKPLFEPAFENPESVKALADQIKADWQTTDSQIEAAIRFVQDKVRYTGINNGIGGYKPDAPEQVLGRRYGDCKDKAMLLAALLKEIDVAAYPALVNSYEGGAISGYLPSPDAFDHMIVKLPNLNGKSYWIDGTRTLQGSKLDTLHQIDYEAALLPAQAKSGLQSYAIESVRLPLREIREQYLLRHNSEPEGSTLKITSTYRSSAAESMRRYIQSTGVRKLQRSYVDYYENRFDTITVIRPLEIIDDRDANTIKLVERYTIDDAWEKSDEGSDETKDSYLLELHADTITSAISMPADKRRRQPLQQKFPVNVVHRIELMTADGWDIQADEKNISNDYFSYRSSSVVKGKTLLLTYKLETYKDVVSVSDSRRYLKSLEKVLDDPYYQVMFEFPLVSQNAQSVGGLLNELGSWWLKRIEEEKSGSRQ